MRVLNFVAYVNKAAVKIEKVATFKPYKAQFSFVAYDNVEQESVQIDVYARHWSSNELPVLIDETDILLALYTQRRALKISKLDISRGW